MLLGQGHDDYVHIVTGRSRVLGVGERDVAIISESTALYNCHADDQPYKYNINLDADVVTGNY